METKHNEFKPEWGEVRQYIGLYINVDSMLIESIAQAKASPKIKEVIDVVVRINGKTKLLTMAEFERTIFGDN